jgi:hypothetical protein
VNADVEGSIVVVVIVIGLFENPEGELRGGKNRGRVGGREYGMGVVEESYSILK